MGSLCGVELGEFTPFKPHSVTASEILAPRVACGVAGDRVAAVRVVVVNEFGFPLAVKDGFVGQLTVRIAQMAEKHFLLLA